jgi:hypothetical protein
VRGHQQEQNEETMKKTSTGKRLTKNTDDMQPEYRFNYKKARPNRFAGRIDRNRLVVIIDKDISKIFSTPESVNSALRALITAMPKATKLTRQIN